MLDSQGYSYGSKDGVLKVKRDDVNVMRAIKKNGLYFLEGTTIVSDTSNVSANVRTITTYKTLLWQSKLGHLGNKGLMELSKRLTVWR